jgi:hypothetical protein
MLFREIISAILRMMQDTYNNSVQQLQNFLVIEEVVHIVTILLYGITTVKIGAMLGISRSIEVLCSVGIM